jgi:hypothetical protein
MRSQPMKESPILNYMKYIHLFEEFMGASGDATPLFAFQGSAEEAKRLELEFHESGNRNIGITPLIAFESSDEVKEYLAEKKRQQINNWEQQDVFSPQFLPQTWT